MSASNTYVKRSPKRFKAVQWYEMGDHPDVVPGFAELTDKGRFLSVRTDANFRFRKNVAEVNSTFLHVFVIPVPTEGGYLLEVSKGDWIVTTLEGSAPKVYSCMKFHQRFKARK